MIGNAQRAIYRLVGSNIRKRREERGMTQMALSQAVGLSRTSVTNVEQGRQTILLHQFVEFARALEIEPHKLLPDAAKDATPEIPREIAVLLKRLKSS